MDNILVIKVGAAGDVARSSSLLNVLEGNVFWVTSVKNAPLFPEWPGTLHLVDVNHAFEELRNLDFDLVLSLEEDEYCAELATAIRRKSLSGVYTQKGSIKYTEDSSPWFDMSRISRLGAEAADKLKRKNTRSYQEFIFRLVGKSFAGEPYCLYRNSSIKPVDRSFGIEKRVGNTWPNKQWWGYDLLAEKLRESGHQVMFFEQRDSIREYMDDIAACERVVSGDSLAMHVAIGYEKKCTAIFNCTSPAEIHDYGNLSKVISPLLSQYFYSTGNDRRVIESVSIQEVLAASTGP